MNSREKGYRAELDVVKVLHRHGWPAAQRSASGVIGIQQALVGDVVDGPRDVHIEVKAGNLHLTAALDQIARDADPMALALLVHKPVRHELLAITYLDQLLPLLRELGR